MAGWTAQEAQGVWAGQPGSILGIPCHTKQRKCLDAECAAAGRGTSPRLSALLPLAHTQPVTHLETSGIWERVFVMDLALVSPSTEGFPPGIWNLVVMAQSSFWE